MVSLANSTSCWYCIPDPRTIHPLYLNNHPSDQVILLLDQASVCPRQQSVVTVPFLWGLGTTPPPSPLKDEIYGPLLRFLKEGTKIKIWRNKKL